MKKGVLLLAAALFLSFSGWTGQAHAVEEGLGNSPFGNPSGVETVGGSCDFQKFKEDLGARESSGNYQAENQFGYLGKYQFGHQALVDLGYKNGTGGWTGKNGINSKADFLNSPQVQEEAMNQWSDQMAREIRSAGLHKYIGKNIGGCEVTMSGLLAGRHLKGIGCKDWVNATSCVRPRPYVPALRAYIESNGQYDPVDGNGTPISQYVCKFSGYTTPYDDEGGHGSASGCGGGMSNSGGPGAGHTNTPEGDADGDGGYGPDTTIDLNNEGIKETWVASMMLMAEQFTANMVKQLEGIGMLFDAKEQLEAQRDFQQRAAEAHKDYQPSEQMCTFGTFSTDLARSQREADLAQDAISREILQRELRSGDSKAQSPVADSLSRIAKFRSSFCEPGDYNNGLVRLCPNPPPAERRNLDIDYTRTIDMKLSLDIDLKDDDVTPDEEAVFALVDYLFMHQSMPSIPSGELERRQFQYHYQNLRSLIAMRGIARNSIAGIIAQKTGAPDKDGGHHSGPYLKALMKELGLPEEEIEKHLGENPSYYAQMELLTKTIYQSPAFYANLYDKPANVQRIRAAMTAIQLMHDRDIQESLHRREMLLSMMLEMRLRDQAAKVYDSASGAMYRR